MLRKTSIVVLNKQAVSSRTYGHLFFKHLPDRSMECWRHELRLYQFADLRYEVFALYSVEILRCYRRRFIPAQLNNLNMELLFINSNNLSPIFSSDGSSFFPVLSMVVWNASKSFKLSASRRSCFGAPMQTTDLQTRGSEGVCCNNIVSNINIFWHRGKPWPHRLP